VATLRDAGRDQPRFPLEVIERDVGLIGAEHDLLRDTRGDQGDRGEEARVLDQFFTVWRS
ncbi:hypothetical protein INQ13_25200, partial [Escherichia coli]|uniref:hypothetical protein n=1 Tax=Escherichia coli TaxID=562 RepID=UPI0019331BB1